MIYVDSPFDDIFLPALFAVFISSLLTVLYACFSLKLSRETLVWKTIMLALIVFSATAFVYQATCGWKKDFLQQLGVVSEPALWQRAFSTFLMAFKLTIDITENYWITSQLISFALPFVAFVNMYRIDMGLHVFVVWAYLGLLMTGSYGATLALFLYHLYNSPFTSTSLPQLTVWQRCTQVISTVIGCAEVVLFHEATLAHLKIASLPILCATFVLPFLAAESRLLEKSKTAEKNVFGIYFFLLLGLFLSFYHIYLTYLLSAQWISFDILTLVAFGHAYQYTISVDVISCMAIISIYITIELHLPDVVKSNIEYSFRHLKVLAVLGVVVLLALILSPGGLFSLFLAFREHYKDRIHYR